MQRKVVRIGNSQGIVIPKTILKLLGWEGTYYIDLKVKEEKIVLTLPVKK